MYKNLIIANWKMNPDSLEKAKQLFDAVKKGVKKIKNASVVICPPFIYLPELNGLTLGAQNFTSAKELKDLNVEYVIIGHSDLRKLGETDEIVNKKIKEALKDGLKVILCIGETLEEKNAGQTQDVLERQLELGLAGISNLKFQISNLIVAYEPVWAISNGDPYQTKEMPTPEKIEETKYFIESVLINLYGKGAPEDVKIIYGGSVNSANAESYLKDTKMQGLLVGGASLNAEEFIKIVKSADLE